MFRVGGIADGLYMFVSCESPNGMFLVVYSITNHMVLPVSRTGAYIVTSLDLAI